jgi:tetraacyldisaccharide 4'-kinase
MIAQVARVAIRDRVARLCPTAVWCEVEHRPAALIDCDARRYSLADVADKPIAAFSGIGNPAGFRHTLESMGCRIAAWREFPDHHNFTRSDVEELAKLANQSGAATLLCTRKDLVKLRVQAIGGTPLRAVAVELNFLVGEQQLRGAALQPLIDRARAVDMVSVDAAVTSADGTDVDFVR